MWPAFFSLSLCVFFDLLFFFRLFFAFNSSKNEVHAIEANRFWWIDTLSLTGNEFHQLLFSVLLRIRSHRFAYGNMLHRSLLTDGLFPVYLFRMFSVWWRIWAGNLFPASISYSKMISPHQMVVYILFLWQFSLFWLIKILFLCSFCFFFISIVLWTFRQVLIHWNFYFRFNFKTSSLIEQQKMFEFHLKRCSIFPSKEKKKQ